MDWIINNKELLLNISIGLVFAITGFFAKEIYFGIKNRISKEEKNINITTRKIELRDIFKNELYKPFNQREPLIGTHRFNTDKIIIKRIGFSEAKKNKPNIFKWYPYFGGEPYNITDDGIMLIIGMEKRNSNKFFKMGLLAYENIITYDLHSDEGHPVMQCKYRGKFGPFSQIDYIKIVDKPL
jgi:hypothetical protein